MLNRLILSLKSIHNSALIPHVIIVIIIIIIIIILIQHLLIDLIEVGNKDITVIPDFTFAWAKQNGQLQSHMICNRYYMVLQCAKRIQNNGMTYI